MNLHTILYSADELLAEADSIRRYRELSSSFRASVAKYRSADDHPEDKAEARRIVARDLAIAKICGTPLAALVALKQADLAALEASR